MSGILVYWSLLILFVFERPVKYVGDKRTDMAENCHSMVSIRYEYMRM